MFRKERDGIMLKEFIELIFCFEMILLLPLIGFEVYLSLSNGKHHNVYKVRNRYIKYVIKLNKEIINTTARFLKMGFLFLKRLLEEIIKYSKVLFWKVLYYREGIKKLDFESFCRGIEGMTPSEFEEFTANLYLGLGYNVKLMPPGPDGGKDVILKDDQGLIYVECKRYLKDVVGREICQKLIGAAIGDEIKRTVLFTCGKVHKNAYEYAEKINHGDNDVNLEIINIEKIYNLYTKSKVTNEVLKLTL